MNHHWMVQWFLNILCYTCYSCLGAWLTTSSRPRDSRISHSVSWFVICVFLLVFSCSQRPSIFSCLCIWPTEAIFGVEGSNLPLIIIMPLYKKLMKIDTLYKKCKCIFFSWNSYLNLILLFLLETHSRHISNIFRQV